jgi:acyl transferase domain-containing protein/NADPH:quinone reductase-like Zn-dependent oxidoreductase/acyl carrier protein/short-subunit dehydrogenase
MLLPKPLAIVGAACRLPGAATLSTFSELLVSGCSAIQDIPNDRWTKSRYFHPGAGQPGKTYSFAAGALPEIFDFDPAFFGISAREAVSVDPQQRLMLELAYEATEDAGLLPSRLAGSATGVFAGASSWDFAAVSFADAASLDAYGMQGAALSSVSNRISYVFGLQGPSLTVDTACSSSLVALHLACEALLRGEIAQAIVGGVNLLIAPQSFVGFARASMLSRLGRCHSFDARADGYVRGEGGGVIIVKTLESALADGDSIRTVIRATGVNSDGRTNGFSMPSGAAQAELVRAVCERAEVTPDDFCYFEAHGTGTPVGDPIEARAIGGAIGQRRSAPLPIGSVKSNIGHLEPASGMAGLMKLLVCFEREVIPPSLNFETPNPNIPFAELNLEVVTEQRALPRAPGIAALVGINSFGFGGTNAHAILAAPPAVAEPAEQPDAAVPGAIGLPLLLSARSTGALRALATAWRETLGVAAPADLPALLRGSARHRDQHSHRMAVTAPTAAELSIRLEYWLADGTADGVATGQSNGGVAFVYSGNGSQWAGMGLDALRTNATFASVLAQVDERLAPGLGWSVIARLSSDDLAASIRHTTVAQPLLFATQVAAVSALRAAGVRPVAHVGHSAGEVAAAWGSGALTLEQACQVIIQRSLLQGATHGVGGMMSVAMSQAAAEALIARLDLPLAVAAVNAVASVTIAGPVEALHRLEAAARETRVHVNRLDLDYAFHSAAMDPIRLPLLTALDGLESVMPTEPLISTVTGDHVGAGELDAEYWWHNVRKPVRFSDAVDRLVGDGVRNFLEVGPQPVLQFYLRDALRGAGKAGRVLGTLSRRPVSGDALALAAAECHVAGADLTTAACFDGAATVRGLPAYPFQRQRYSATRSIESVEVTAPIEDHPLLGFRDPASREAWMSHLSTASHPWLAEHVVDGAAVLPAAAMIDMALAAARVRHPDAVLLEIQDLEISHALVLEANTVTDCRTTVTPDGHWQLASRPRLSPEPTQAHATCRIIPGLGERPILPVIQPAGAQEIDAATVYARARTLHLDYGPAFRTVLRVHRLSAMQGAAELRASDPDRLSAGYLLDPAVLDGALQALLALVVGDVRVTAMGAVLPWRFGRIRLLRADVGPTQAGPTRASLHVRHIGPRSICADIGLSDADGETVAELLDCWFVAMPAPGQAASDQVFRTAYIPSIRQPAVALPQPADRVIAAANGVEDLPESMLLADICVTAIAHEALLGLSEDHVLPAHVAIRPLVAAALPWLEQDGLVTRQPDGWRVERAGDLPSAVEIWRSLMFGSGETAAECVMLAALGPALTAGDASALQLSSVLRDQALFASASARETMAAQLRGLGAFTATWPAGRCLRVAVVGALHAGLLHQVLERIQARGIPLRLVALATDQAALAGVQDVLAQTPGASAALWAAMPDAAWFGFDLVLDLYGLSLPSQERLTPEQILRLLAPSGLLLAAEPVPNRTAALLFGFGLERGVPAALQPPEAWCDGLRAAGFASACQTLLDGAIWPACLLVASAPGDQGGGAAIDRWAEQDGLIVFAAPNDRLAAALAAHQNMLHLLPIEAMREVLTAPFAARQQHVLLLASDTTDDDDCAEALAELLADISTALHGMPPSPPPRLWLVSSGSPAESIVSAALTGLRRVAANELAGLDCRTIALDSALPDAEAADRILQELADPDQETEVVWCNGGRLVPRLRAGLPEPPLAGGPRRLEVARPGLIGSLVWVPGSPTPPGPHEVAIDVHASALNFRDVMWAQGLLPDEALLEGFSGPSLGLECAGVVSAVGEGVDDLRPGDRVAAVAPAALATHVVTRRNGVMRMPASIPFAAAATMPVAFMTAVYALGHLARLEAGETVLIHGGAGGVGLAAIQYALHKGAVVYATAGSDARRQMLRMLGASAVFDSRSTSFVDDILAMTGAKGVDVVLNSVSLELMKQSVRLLRPFGRFLEIGKRDLYRDTPIGVRALRHNASYFAIDVDELVAHRPDVGLRVLQEVSDLLAAGELRPLPYRAYGFRDAVAAFRLLQSSGHVGKVVLLPEPTKLAAQPAPFRLPDDGVTVVTGGLTGFGLEAARWIARQGGRRLALISRRGAATPDADKVLAEFAAGDVDARAFACDVAEPARLARVLDEIRHCMGPIRGVVHAAMVLDDALLQDLDATRFATVIRGKLTGALALDRLTRADPIALFVLFSSVTTVIGTPGQASYVAANRTLEAVAERRHAEGLPALAVQWGPIADAGYLVRETRVSEMLAAMLGSAHLRAAQALEALPALLASGRPVVGLADVSWAELRGRLAGLAGPFWSEMPVRDRSTSAGLSLSARLAQLTPEEAVVAVEEVLVDEIARILQQPPGTISTTQPINEFGVDSLMAVELQTALEVRLGQQIPLTALTGAATLSAIAARLVKMMDKHTVADDDAIVATILRHEAEAVTAEADAGQPV